MKIGVLALQGAFKEHIDILTRLGAEVMEVRLGKDLGGLDGLVIPGGESTTIGKLAVLYDLVAPLRRFAESKAVWGICAGMILMAKRIDGDQPRLGIMDMAVSRNAFGRQVDSFETGVTVDGLGDDTSEPFPAVFIRAPKVIETWGEASVIARLDTQTAVAVRQQRHLATAFHPELTADPRLHRYFLKLVQS
jgi:5'-phosphate synthase pdxT subunit